MNLKSFFSNQNSFHVIIKCSINFMKIHVIWKSDFYLKRIYIYEALHFYRIYVYKNTWDDFSTSAITCQGIDYLPMSIQCQT